MTSQQNDLELIRCALFSGQKSVAKSQAQAAFLRLVEQLPTPPSGRGEISQQDINEVQDLLESIPTNLEEDRRNSRVIAALGRARVVGVLDAFVSRHALIACHVVVWGTDGGQAMHMCELRDAAGNVLDWRGGDDPDAARAAAAESVETKRLP